MGAPENVCHARPIFEVPHFDLSLVGIRALDLPFPPSRLGSVCEKQIAYQHKRLADNRFYDSMPTPLLITRDDVKELPRGGVSILYSWPRARVMPKPSSG